MRKGSKINKLWPAFKRRLSRLGLGISGSYFTVKDIPSGSQDIGFTGAGNSIFLSHDHPILDGLASDEEVLQFIKGVFLHELMHQIETDFDETKRITDKLPSTAQKRIFMTIANVIEDPSIEYHASKYMGGDAIKALHFSVKKIYQQHEVIDPAAPAFAQYVQALIQYGDGGLLKGDFTSDDAKNMFVKTIPLIDEAIEEPSGRNRLRKAKDVFEMTRPLWENDVKEQEELEELLKKLMESLGKNFASSGGHNKSVRATAKSMSGEGDPDGEQDSVKKRRNITFRKVSKEEAEKMKKNGSASGSIPPEGDIEVLIVEDDEKSEGSDSGSGIPMPGMPGSSSKKQSKKNSSSASGGSDGKKSEEEKSDDANGGNVDGSDEDKSSEENSGDSSKNGNNSESGNSEGDKSSTENSDAEDKPYNPETTSYSSSGSQDGDSSSNSDGMRISYDEEGGEMNCDDSERGAESSEDLNYELSEEEAKAIADDISECLTDLACESREDAQTEDLEIPDLKGKYPTVSCLNESLSGTAVSESLSESYDTLVAKMKPGIKRLSSQLQRIIRNDAEDIAYRNSGKVNIKRLSDARLTSRVFDRRIEPGNKANMSVLLAIDCSGSMWGRKISLARECVIALAETFAALKIPLKVIGFTADTKGFDAVHYHYVNWKSSKKERVKLLSIEANSDNFDGYSIRYAGKILGKRNEAHKLLIVISDGQPACYYYGGRAGITDTKDAIREVKQSGINVIGVAIDADTNILHSMYGSSFLMVSNLKQMFETIGNKVKKEVALYD